MIVDKKRVFLYSSILLLILAGVYFVNSVGFANRNPLQTFANATGEVNGSQCMTGGSAAFCGSSYPDLANWTRGGNTETYRFTIDLDSYTSGTANNNVTRINITGGGTGATSAFPTGISLVGLSGLGNATFSTGTGANNNWSINITSTEVSAFNQSYPIMGVNGLYGNITIQFNATVANGTETIINWTIKIYNSTGGNITNGVIDDGLGILTGVDGLPPRGNTTNVTDGTNLITSFSGTKYLQYNPTSPQRGVNITLTVNDYNIDRVLLVYNNTGGSINFTLIRNNLYSTNFTHRLAFSTTDGTNSTFTILEYANGNNATKANLTTLDTRSDVRLTTAPGYVFSFNISNNTWGEGASDGTTFKYVFVVYDLYNHSEILNNSNAEYVIARDVANPTVTLTAPSDTTIDINGPIKYTCSGSDTSSIASCSMVLTKPNGDTVTKTGCSEQTFTTTDTNGAGTNTVQCTVTDDVGRTTSTSSTFSVSAATTTSGGGGGGGSGGGSSGTTADNPVTVKTGESVDAGTLSSTTETFTSVAKEGTVSFTVAGSSHSAKVLDVTTTSVTIEVSSTPQQLTLNIGDTKEVDLTDDGKSDLSVTLKSITDGKADLVFKSLEVSAVPSGETGGAGVVTGEGAKSSNTWLWVALIVVVLVLVIWYLGRKKQ